MGKIGGLVSGTGRLSKVAVSVFQAGHAIAIMNYVGKFPAKIEAWAGKEYTDLARENPIINFFMMSCIIIFATSFLMVLFYSAFGIKMGKNIRRYVVIAPFLCVVCGLVYFGHIYEAMTTDPAHMNFDSCKSKDEVDYIMQMKGKSHRKEFLKYEEQGRNYVHEMISKRMSQSFYESMLDELAEDQINSKFTHTLTINTPVVIQQERELNVIGFSWAAYCGNIDYIRAVDNCKKGLIISEFIMNVKTKVPCKGFFEDAHNLHYTIIQTHTPYSLAVDRGNMDCYRLIEKMLENSNLKTEDGARDWRGYNNRKKGECNFGGSEDRSIVGDIARAGTAIPIQMTKGVAKFGVDSVSGAWKYCFG